MKYNLTFLLRTFFCFSFLFFGNTSLYSNVMYWITLEETETQLYQMENGEKIPVLTVYQGDKLLLKTSDRRKNSMAVVKVNDDFVYELTFPHYKELEIDNVKYKIIGTEAFTDSGPWDNDRENSISNEDSDEIKNKGNKSVFILDRIAKANGPKNQSHLPFWLGVLFFIISFVAIANYKENFRTWVLAFLSVLILCICVIIQFHYTGNYMWFMENDYGLIRSTFMALLFTAFSFLTVAWSYMILNTTTKLGNFEVSYIVGYGCFIILLPVYFILWIFCDDPIEYLNWFLIGCQIYQVGLIFYNCIMQGGNILMIIPTIVFYPFACLATFLLVKQYIFDWFLDLFSISSLANIFQHGLW